MKSISFTTGALAAALGIAAFAVPAAAQTYNTPGPVYQRPALSVPGQPGPVISAPNENPDGALVYHGYGNKTVRVTPSGMRSNVYGQPCHTVEKTDQKGLLRSYTYCR